MASCTNCEFGKENKQYSYYSKMYMSLEENTFYCNLHKRQDVPRRYLCKDYQRDKTIKTDSFCINCDKITPEKDWMCSECLCDIPDSEIFEDLDGNIY